MFYIRFFPLKLLECFGLHFFAYFTGTLGGAAICLG